ncbi:MAG TPA: glycoside hydrolase family 16 protein [Chitinophagaceae bacterium]|nr:glycoside hydrolase family 16 protein [Chitinophagaceae bacterium]
MKILKTGALLLTAGLICFSCKKASSQNNVLITDKGWTFETTPSWADEFNVDGKPDSSKWGYDVGGSGWGNHEKEYYTEGENSLVKNGILSIEARKENVSGMNYTSARMVTKDKGDFLYGKFEIRAKLPTGKGLWPAIWMLPTDNAYGDWPKSGEVDIMEQVGFDPNNIHISTHTEAFNWILNTQTTTITNVPAATTDFHVYRIDWTPYAIRGFIDGEQKFQFVNDGKGAAHWPFDKRFHILLNVAIGGDWGGQHGIDDNIFPAKMEVDYVRVYKMIEK